jgi:hypothetical protein
MNGRVRAALEAKTTKEAKVEALCALHQGNKPLPIPKLLQSNK